MFQDGQVARPTHCEAVDHFHASGRRLSCHGVAIKVGKGQEALHAQLEIELEAGRVFAGFGRADKGRARQISPLRLDVNGQLFVKEAAHFL